jgi:adenosine/AMP kinase
LNQPSQRKFTMSQPKKPSPRHGSKVLTKNARRAHKVNCAAYEKLQKIKKGMIKVLSRAAYPANVLNEIVTVTTL